WDPRLRVRIDRLVVGSVISLDVDQTAPALFSFDLTHQQLAKELTRHLDCGSIEKVAADHRAGRRDAASLFRHRPSGEPNDGSACRRTALCRRAGTWPASPWSASTR